jgi:hypothetical protein
MVQSSQNTALKQKQKLRQVESFVNYINNVIYQLQPYVLYSNNKVEHNTIWVCTLDEISTLTISSQSIDVEMAWHTGCKMVEFPVDFFLCCSCRAMAQVVSRQPFTAEARVRSRVNPCRISGGQSGTGAGFSPSSSVFPCQHIIPPSAPKLISSGQCVIC